MPRTRSTASSSSAKSRKASDADTKKKRPGARMQDNRTEQNTDAQGPTRPGAKNRPSHRAGRSSASQGK